MSNLQRTTFRSNGLVAGKAPIARAKPGAFGPVVPAGRPRRAHGKRRLVAAVCVLAMLVAPMAGIGASPAGRSEEDARPDPRQGPAATDRPVWPGSWSLLVTDGDGLLSAKVVDILEVRTSGSGWDDYFYVRIVDGPRPLLDRGDPLPHHSWWIYLDLTGDGNNDWLVEERATGICSLRWNGTGARWGTSAGCDVYDTSVDSDVGSAVRAVGCSQARECVDFALERSDYPGLGGSGLDLILTGAAHRTEDLNLSGDGSRNPRDAPIGCDPAYIDDCTPPARVFITIPEFPSLFAVVGIIPPLLLAVRRRAVKTRARRTC